MGNSPADVIAAGNEKARRLRQLIQADEILVMPGAYDAMTARLFESMGFKAIQGSSGAIAAHLGYQDGERVSREQTIEATRRIAEAVSAPVNADGEKGYGDADGVRETVRGFILAGVAGMNLEDSEHHLPNRPWGLLPLEQQLAKLAALFDTRKEMGSEFFLNARVDALLVMRNDVEKALPEAIARGRAYAAAGADCVLFMNAVTPEVISELVRNVPAPVSVLAGPQTPPVHELQKLGVKRVSYGSAFAYMAAGAVHRLATEILEKGTITARSEAMPRDELNKFLL